MANTPLSNIAILDVGTTKLCCILAHVDDAGEIHVDGIGHHVAEGVKNGVVTDMGLAENAIRSVVQSAEDMAGRTIDDIIIVTTAGDISSSIFSVEVAVSGHEVEAADIKRVLKLARKQMADEPRTILHALPACYSVDNAMGVRSPEGMFGERLGVDFHMVTADPSPLQNLATCVQRCHLNVTSLIAAPYAAGHAVLHDEEKELGVACVDMGGGSTSISLF
ncbi:MAG: cell division protein FtsA, partial [Sphingomonadales bacterium]